jgi:hypothetical protein
MAFDLGNILQQYLGGGAANQANTLDDFDQVAQSAPRSTVAQGVTEALRSEQTPPFPKMVSELFGHSDASQRAGMLNQLLGSVGPGLLASVAGGAFGNLFGGQANHAATPTITEEQAATMTPQQVEQIAAQAEQHNPGVVDRMGDFYAQHPTLVKTIGGAALAIVLGRVAQGMQR